MSSFREKWERYESWNAALVAQVYPPTEDPQPIYMDLEDEVLGAVAETIGLDPANAERALTEAVRGTLWNGSPAEIFRSHEEHMVRWIRRGRRGDPPFVGVLAVFCIAAERMDASDGMSANNYMGRLRDVLGWGSDRRLDTAYRNVAERFWGELNRWLLDNDGVRGLPTAFALSHRFVGLTVSQALVRSADRERLKDFFRDYGFTPGVEVPPGELTPVMDAWMRGAHCPASNSLQQLWKRKTARERIAQAAAVSLASWDGSLREGDDHSGRRTPSGRLALTMRMTRFPRRSFELGAIVYLPRAEEARALEVLSAPEPTSVDVVPEMPGALSMHFSATIHAEDALEGQLSMRDPLTDRSSSRMPRRAILFRQDPASRRWIEAPQVMRGDDVQMLARRDLMPRLREILGVIARPGFEFVTDFPGLPENWVAITGLEIFGHPGDLVPDDRVDDLACLVPLTRTQLKAAGGFVLPGNVRKWHSWMPPEIRAVSDSEQGFLVRVVDEQRFAEVAEEEVLAEVADEGGGVVVLDLAELELGDGDYRVELVSANGNDVSSSTTVRLRSAETPDLQDWDKVDLSGYGRGVAALGVPTERVLVRGMQVDESPDAVTRAPSSDAGDLPQRWSNGASQSRTKTRRVRLSQPDPASCIFTGRHKIWISTVPTTATGRPLEPWSFGRCTSCGLERRFSTSHKKLAWQKRQAAEEQMGRPEVDLRTLSPVAEKPSAEDAGIWATALDAIFHTGGGRWSALERIASQVEAEALFVDGFTRMLEVLGHIDVVRNPLSLRSEAWQASATTVAGTVASGGFVSGYWPDSLFLTFVEQAEARGLSVAKESATATPDSYFVEGDWGDVIEAAALTDEGIVTVDSCWKHLLGALPALSEVAAGLPAYEDSFTGEIVRYEAASNRWEPSPDTAAPGGYRLKGFSTTDVARVSDGSGGYRLVRSTVQLSKHLAAALDGVPLIAFDAATGNLVVPLGADLPGLYGRTAVAASGRPPIAVPEKRLLVYEQVPPDLAHGLLRLLVS